MSEKDFSMVIFINKNAKMSEMTLNGLKMECSQVLLVEAGERLQKLYLYSGLKKHIIIVPNLKKLEEKLEKVKKITSLINIQEYGGRKQKEKKQLILFGVGPLSYEDVQKII